ncbi:hypothetical protein AVEN_213484-1, partial [Araneus ventricosus]
CIEICSRLETLKSASGTARSRNMQLCFSAASAIMEYASGRTFIGKTRRSISGVSPVPRQDGDIHSRTALPK